MSDRQAPEATPLRPCGEIGTLVRGLRCALPTGHTGRHQGNFGAAVILWGGDRWASALD